MQENEQPTEQPTETEEAPRAPEILRQGVKQLPVPLTPSEFNALAKKKARAEAELRQIEQDAADTAKSFKQRVSDVEKTIERMGAELVAESVDRAVEFVERYNFGPPTAMIELVRLDTGAVFDRRAPSIGEMQRFLPGVGGPAGERSVLGDMTPESVLDEAAGEDIGGPFGQDDPDEGGQSEDDPDEGGQSEDDPDEGGQVAPEPAPAPKKRGRKPKAG